MALKIALLWSVLQTCALAQYYDFNDNQIPPGWSTYVQLVSNVRVANGALQIGPNTIGGIARAIETGSAAQVRVDYDVSTSQPLLNSLGVILLTSQTYAQLSSSGIAGAQYGNADGPLYSTITFGPQGQAYTYYDNRRVAGGEYQGVEFRVQHVFQDGSISQAIVDRRTGAVVDRVTVSVPGFTLRAFQYLWLYSAENAPDTQVVTTYDNLSISYTPSVPPVADAGPNLVRPVGQTVALSGSNSYSQDTPSALLQYSWTLLTRPSGSQATISGAQSAAPSFLLDRAGNYIVQLVVTDPLTGLSSLPVSTTVSSTWSPPTADPGPNQAVIVGSTVTLDGLKSSDPNGLPLSYSWSLVGVPPGSTASPRSGQNSSYTFVTDRIGSYAVTLTVSDIYGSSLPRSVSVIAVSPTAYAELKIASALAQLAQLPMSAFAAPGHRIAMASDLMQALAAIQLGRTSTAESKIAAAISRTDGVPLRGAVDTSGQGRDWIADPAVQVSLYSILNAALAAIHL